MRMIEKKERYKEWDTETKHSLWDSRYCRCYFSQREECNARGYKVTCLDRGHKDNCSDNTNSENYIHNFKRTSSKY